MLQSRTQLTRCWGTVPSSFPSLPRVASSGTEAWRTPFRGLPHTGQLALPAALGTRWSPCRRPSRDAQTEDLRSPTSTGLGRGVAAPFARRRPNRGCALRRGGLTLSCFLEYRTPPHAQRHSAAAPPAAPFSSRTPRSAIRQPHASVQREGNSSDISSDAQFQPWSQSSSCEDSDSTVLLYYTIHAEDTRGRHTRKTHEYTQKTHA